MFQGNADSCMILSIFTTGIGGSGGFPGASADPPWKKLLEADGPQGVPPAVEWASGGEARMSMPCAGRGVPPDAATPKTSCSRRDLAPGEGTGAVKHQVVTRTACKRS